MSFKFLFHLVKTKLEVVDIRWEKLIVNVLISTLFKESTVSFDFFCFFLCFLH